MKIEFEFNIDKDGNPIIKFRHYDKSEELEHKLLAIFIEQSIENGIKITNTSGSIGSDSSEKCFSYNNYELKVKNQPVFSQKMDTITLNDTNKMKSILRWLLGLGDEFPEPDRIHAYWWRTELAKKIQQLGLKL